MGSVYEGGLSSLHERRHAFHDRRRQGFFTADYQPRADRIRNRLTNHRKVKELAATDEKRVKDTVVLLGAGAPNSPLMAGALAAMYEKKFPLDMIYTSGGGCLIGLLLVAPKGPSPVKALRGLVEQM